MTWFECLTRTLQVHQPSNAPRAGLPKDCQWQTSDFPQRRVTNTKIADPRAMPAPQALFLSSIVLSRAYFQSMGKFKNVILKFFIKFRKIFKISKSQNFSNLKISKSANFGRKFSRPKIFDQTKFEKTFEFFSTKKISMKIFLNTYVDPKFPQDSKNHTQKTVR